MSAVASRRVERCPACGAKDRVVQAVRRDGTAMLRCTGCGSIYLEEVPVDVVSLYRDNYFALSEQDARGNIDARIGYEASYESSYLDAEFYWAYRIADFVAAALVPGPRVLRCLDVGAATGRLLNVFAAAGYETHGVEFSAPARAIAQRRGPAMTAAPVGSLPEHAGRFPIITALEVIEHVEDLGGFFAGIHAALSEGGVFVGYFPSADAAAFARGPDYHWLHHSFEHLVYPSEVGIRAVLAERFGDQVHVCTYLTRQGDDVIPNSIVVAIKGDPSRDAARTVAETFRQLAYLNDRAWFAAGAARGPGALGSAWDAAARAPIEDPSAEVPYVVGVLCAKFGEFEVARHLRRGGMPVVGLDPSRQADLLVMAMHDGGVDWMRANLPVIGASIRLGSIVAECSAFIERYDAANTASAPEAAQGEAPGGATDTGDHVATAADPSAAPGRPDARG
ncbi:MAG: class I SAM-dependent methyltransferase [Burkholderiales bacterium]